MTRAEVEAFNSGVLAVAAIVRQAASRLRPRLSVAPLRYERAVEALEAVAEAAVALVIASGGDDQPDPCGGAPRVALPAPPAEAA